MFTKRLPLLVLLATLFFPALSNVAVAADDENCLMCHKYRKMGRITEEGARKYYYVDEPEFMQTVHFNVKCRDCHDYIDRIPHKEVAEGVNCAKECHIKNPATGKFFSHKMIDETYQKSVHGRPKLPEGTNADMDKDKPYCIYCHINPKYNPGEKDPPVWITKRCVVCHEDEEFVNHWYSHTARRIKEVMREPKEVVALCSSCHEDEEMMHKHKLEGKALHAADSYKASFHGSMVKLGWGKPAHCLSCHADADNYFLSVHDIRKADDPKATIHPDNRHKICAKCHKGSGKNYATIDEVHYNPHVNHPIEFYVEEFFFWLTAGSFFALILLITLDHNRRMWDKIRGKGHGGHW